MKPWHVLFDRRTQLILLATIGSVAGNLTSAEAADTVRTFQETDETFANPGQGWMTTRRLPGGPGRFPYSVAYFRLNWEDLEPAEGQYNWQLIDESLAAWAKREVRIAFRIMTTNAHTKGYYCSPQWLFDAGCKSYDYLIERGWSFDRALDFMAANHVTFINDNIGKVPPEQMPELGRLGRRAGYRFVLREISHPDSISAGETLSVVMKWSNVGVGKLYRRYPLVLYLLDAKDTIICRQTQADVDPTAWLPGDQSVTASLRLPESIPAGQYSLALAFVDSVSGKPAIRLAIDAPQTDRLYHVGSLRVK